MVKGKVYDGTPFLQPAELPTFGDVFTVVLGLTIIGLTLGLCFC